MVVIIRGVIPRLTFTTAKDVVECGAEDVDASSDKEYFLPSSYRWLCVRNFYVFFLCKFEKLKRVSYLSFD